MLPQFDFGELRSKPHWSFSSLNQLLNICSQQYAFRKVENLVPEHVSVNLVFGKAFHQALGQYYLSLRDKEQLPLVKIQQSFREWYELEVHYSSIPIQYPESKDAQWYIEKGQQMVQAIVENTNKDDEVIGVDVALKADLPGIAIPLITEFDLLVENKGRLVVVDFKTSAAKWPADKAHKDLQATAYLYALRQYCDKPSLFRYDVVTKTKEPSFNSYYTDRTEADFKRFTQQVAIAEKIVANSLYYPHEQSFSCGDCPYSTACSNWSQAAA